MELSSLLRELGCPHNILTEGPVTKRLETRKSVATKTMTSASASRLFEYISRIFPLPSPLPLSLF